MNNRLESLEKTGERHRSNVLSLSIAVGLIVFFITSEWTGGLTGVQGFFVGAFSVLALYIFTVVLGEYQIKTKKEGIKKNLNVPGDISVSRSEEEGITIHIRLSKDLASSIEREKV